MATEVKSKIQFKNANRGPIVSLFSAVEGRLTNNGQAAAGIKVERKYNFGWVDKDFSDNTYTDENGRYEFAEATKFMLLGSILPHEAVIPQKIMIYPKAGAQGLEIWHHVKRNYDTMGELDGLAFYVEHTAVEQQSAVMKAYAQGKLSLSCDLATVKPLDSDDFEFQNVNSFTAVISAADLQLPYQQKINRAKVLVTEQQAQIKQALAEHLRQEPKALASLKEERFKGYQNLTFVAVESISLYDHYELEGSEQDYASDNLTLQLGGEVILQMKNSQEQQVRIRMWLSYAPVRIDAQGVKFLDRHHTLVFNEFNINADDEA